MPASLAGIFFVASFDSELVVHDRPFVHELLTKMLADM